MYYTCYSSSFKQTDELYKQNIGEIFLHIWINHNMLNDCGNKIWNIQENSMWNKTHFYLKLEEYLDIAGKLV